MTRTTPRLLGLFFYSLPILLALGLLQLISFKTDLSAFIISGKTAEETLLASEMQSGTLSRRYLISIGTQTQTAPDSRFIQLFIQQVKNIEGVADVWLPTQQTALLNTLKTLYAPHASSIYSLTPAQDLAELFTDTGLRQQAHFLRQALLSPQSGWIKPIAIQDPLLLTLNGFRSLATQFTPPKPSPYQNLIVATHPSGMNAAAQSRIQRAIKQQFQTLNTNHHYQLEMTGVPVFAVATQQLIQGDIIKVSVFSTAALILLFWSVFRSVVRLIQVFTLLLIAILSAMLITGLIFGSVHGMTIAIGVTLIGICIDYPIHALIHIQQAQSQSPVHIVRKLWPSMLLGGTTTLIGYLALGISGYPGFQQVAVFAATGIIVALAITRFILPVLPQTNRPLRPFNWANAWIAFCQRHRNKGYLLLFLMTISAASSLPHLQWMTDMQQLTPELDYLKQQDKCIRERMISIEPGRFIMVSGESLDTALEHAESVYRTLEQLKKQQVLSDYFALFPWLLSRHQQTLNQQQLKTYLTAKHLQQWQAALAAEKLSLNKLGHFNYAFNTLLSPDEVLKSPVKKLIDSRIFSTQDKTIILVWLSQHQPKVLQQAFADSPYAHYFSQRDLLNTMLKNYTQTAKNLLSAGLGLILLLMLLRYKSLIKTLTTLLPAVLSALFILAGWALTGTAISFLHLVAFLLVVAICVDYGIFYQENRGNDIQVTYQAMAVSMLTSALAFGSMLIAESSSLRILASVVSLGVLLGFLLCPLIIRPHHPVKS